MNEVEVLLAGGRADDPRLRHLASPLAGREYVRMADAVARVVDGGSRVLDWGCGAGQLSWLLDRRGLAVTSYDVAAPGGLVLRPVRGGHPHALPFRRAAFDAVVGCGVLEHVADEERSLAELRRVLVPAGRLFIFNLPQRWSYKEMVIDRLRLGYSHDRRYTERSVRALVEGAGFRVVALARAGFLPHLATGFPPVVRQRYYRMAGVLHPVDRILSRVPLLNRVGESLEVVAEAEAEATTTR